MTIAPRLVHARAAVTTGARRLTRAAPPTFQQHEAQHMAGMKRDASWPPGAEGRLLRAHNHGVELHFLVERFGRDAAEIRSKLRELAAGGAQVRGFENITPLAKWRAGSNHMTEVR